MDDPLPDGPVSGHGLAKCLVYNCNCKCKQNNMCNFQHSRPRFLLDFIVAYYRECGMDGFVAGMAILIQPFFFRGYH